MLVRIFLAVFLASLLVCACSDDGKKAAKPNSARGKSQRTKPGLSATKGSSNTATGTNSNTTDSAKHPPDGFGSSFKELIGQPQLSLKEAIGQYVANKDRPKVRDLMRGALIAFDDKHRDYDSAEVLLTEIIRREPNNGEAYYLRGRARCCTINMKDDEGLQDFEKALQLGVVSSELHEYRARVYDGRHQPEKALAELDQAIKIKPTQPQYYRTRATLYLGMDKKAEAKKDYDTALKLNPKDAYVYLLRGQLLESMNKNEEALRDYRNASDSRFQEGKFNKRIVALKAQAQILYKMGRFKEAIEALNVAASDENSDEELIVFRGRCHAALGHNDLAIKDFTRAINLAPAFSWQAYLERSKVYDTVGKHDLAQKDRAESKRLQAEPAEKGLYSPPQ